MPPSCVLEEERDMIETTEAQRAAYQTASILNLSQLLSIEKMSEQLTLMEAALLSRVVKSEFIVQLLKDHQTPNLQKLHDRFNSVSRWVAHNVLLSEAISEKVEIFKLFCTLANVSFLCVLYCL